MCNVEITLVDEDFGGPVILLGSVDVSIMWTSIAFSSEHLTLNRRYSVRVNASNINGSAVSNSYISKYGQSTSSPNNLLQ